MKVTISAINRTQKQTQYGVKEQVGMKIEESTITDVNGASINVADRWLNSFNTKGTENWDNGMSVNIDVIEKDGKYLNFKVGSASSAPSPELESRVAKLEEAVFGPKEEANDSF